MYVERQGVCVCKERETETDIYKERKRERERRVWPRIRVRVRLICHFVLWHFVQFFVFWHFVRDSLLVVARGFPRCKLNYFNQKLFQRTQIINFENNKYATCG